MSLPPPHAGVPPTTTQRFRVSLALLLGVAWLLAAAVNAWAVAALAIDFPVLVLRLPVAIVYAAALLACVFFLKKRTRALAAAWAGFAIVLLWWLFLPASNSRDWQPDVAREPWAEFDGGRVIVHNVRNCVYRSETDFDAVYEDREYDLDRIQSVDLFLVNWGSPLISHTMMSFGFDDGQYLCASIEARKEKGEGYSALLGLFRRFELMYVLADERDLVRLRTNFRKGENVRLYRLHTRPDGPRLMFLEYLKQANRLRGRPRWYNAITTNCTTSIMHNAHQARRQALPWDWRFLANGRLDELLQERGSISSNLPLTTLRQRSLINKTAQLLTPDAGFSAEIRRNLPTKPGVATIP